MIISIDIERKRRKSSFNCVNTVSTVVNDRIFTDFLNNQSLLLVTLQENHPSTKDKHRFEILVSRTFKR